MQEYQNITHTFEPIYDEKSKILILGSFPSVKSRENQNRAGERIRYLSLKMSLKTVSF